MAEQTIAEKAEQWSEIGKQFGAGLVEAGISSNIAQVAITAIADIVGALLGVGMTTMAPIGIGLAKGMANAEDIVAPAFADMAANAVEDLFGTPVDRSAFAQSRNRGGREGAANALARGLVDQITGKVGAIEPGDEAALRYLTSVTQMALEDWFKGWFFEVLSSLVPQLDIGKIESYGALGDQVAQVLGLGRISRTVLRPLVDATVVTPLEWKTNKTYRPKLLTAGEVARQVARGRMTREDGIEELARQGYTDARIEALFNAVRRFHSVADVDLLVRAQLWDRATGVQHLRDQGYDSETADLELRLEKLKRIATFERALATEAVNAYADRRIERHEMADFLRGATLDPQETNQLAELGDMRRAMRQHGLSPGEAKACVKAGILSVIDYRRALEREHYTPEAVLALELLLRQELDEASTIDQLRERQRLEREQEEAARTAAAAARREEVERERLQARRGPIGKLEDAVVRGLIPMSRLEEVLSDEYDPDTVAILVDLVEARQLEAIERQRQRDLAAQRVERRGISVGDLESAVLAGVTSIADYRRRLEVEGFTPEDIELLAGTLAARLAAQQATQRDRDEAAKRATVRKIDLGRFEQLVRRGVRTTAHYAALLAELGFDEPSRAAMVELLELRIAEDAAARELRGGVEGELAERGLSLDQIERAVLLGVMSIDQYQQFLVEQRFTADAQQALTALLRERLTEAEAARARRRATTDTTGGRVLPLATVARAARLGVISPDVYIARLEAAGYAPDDIEIELELLLLEIADVQAQRARRDAAEADAAARGLSLATLERAVKAGAATIEDYRARAAALGHAGADLELLVRLLQTELAQLADARARREEIRAELETREFNLGQLEALVKGGLKTLDDYFAELQGLGYAADDAELLTELLAGELADTGA